MSEPLQIVFDVECPPERAFELWTRRTSMWWPASHTVSGEPGLEVIVEPGIGGRIFERTSGGQEHDWGEITVWEPPSRLAYRWYLRQSRSEATEVEITFQPTDRDHTTVAIVHSGWERLGARAPERRDQNQHGWNGLLPHFRKAAAAR